MKVWSNEVEARDKIKELVAQYYHDFKENKTEFQPGDRINYAARVFDEREMCALTDATLDFGLLPVDSLINLKRIRKVDWCEICSSREQWIVG